MPENIKRMIEKDTTVIYKMRKKPSTLAHDTKIWTYPSFRSIGQLTNKSDPLTLIELDPFKFAEAFPDPIDYCIGIFTPIQTQLAASQRISHVNMLDS